VRRFEEYENGIVTVSDVVEVEDEDPANTGSIEAAGGSWWRGVGNSQLWVCAPWLAHEELRDRNDSPILV